MHRPDDRAYDKLNFEVSCWSDFHWQKLKEHWERITASAVPDLTELDLNQALRDRARIVYPRSFWFDITKVWRGRKRQ